MDKELDALYDAALAALEDEVEEKAANKAANDLTDYALSEVSQAIEQANKHFVCDECEKPKETATFRIDPYDADVFNREVYRMLCDDCEREARLSV